MNNNEHYYSGTRLEGTEMLPFGDTFCIVFSDHEFIPNTVESLVELVAENGDEYEDRLRSRKIDMHSSLW